MIKFKWIVGLAALVLSGCQAIDTPRDSGHPLAWLAGCWQTTDGDTVERWDLAAETLLFGSNVLFSEQQVSFFEQMRIERDANRTTFFAYPMGRAPTAFPAVDQASQSIVFENAETDYPQRIRYWRDGVVLQAEISLLDGTKNQRWVFKRCVAN